MSAAILSAAHLRWVDDHEHIDLHFALGRRSGLDEQTDRCGLYACALVLLRRPDLNLYGALDKVMARQSNAEFQENHVTC